MDASELHPAVEDRPLAVCGPIVRRVNRTPACVFLPAREAFVLWMGRRKGVPGPGKAPGTAFDEVDRAGVGDEG